MILIFLNVHKKLLIILILEYKFLGYGRCGTVRKRIEEEARMRTTTAPTTVIPDIHKMTTRKMPVPVTKNANSISN